MSCEDIKEMHKFKPEIQAGKRGWLKVYSYRCCRCDRLKSFHRSIEVLKCFPQTSRKQTMAAEGDDVAISSNKKFPWVSKRSDQFMFVRI